MERSFYRDAICCPAANPYKSLSLQCRSSVQRYSSQGPIDEIPLVTFLTVMFKKNPLGTFKQHENAGIFQQLHLHVHQTGTGW